jgi:uncharacterized membrane protein
MNLNSSGRPAGRPRVGVPRYPSVRIPSEQFVLARMRTSQDRLVDAITAFAGSLRFVYFHAAWFGLWIVVNLGAFGQAAIFDKYPFGLLTMIVSLEAIFLSTFVMVSQNRQAARENVRADLDFENNIRSEVWSVHIGKQLGLDPANIEERVQAVIAKSREAMSGTATEKADPLDF